MLSKNWRKRRIGEYGKMLFKENNLILELKDIWKIFQSNRLSCDRRKWDLEELQAVPEDHQLVWEGGTTIRGHESQLRAFSRVACELDLQHASMGDCLPWLVVAAGTSPPMFHRMRVCPMNGTGCCNLQGLLWALNWEDWKARERDL